MQNRNCSLAAFYVFRFETRYKHQTRLPFFNADLDVCTSKTVEASDHLGEPDLKLF